MDNPSQERVKTPAGAKPGSSQTGREGSKEGLTAKSKPLSNREKALAKVVSMEDAEKVLSEAGCGTIGQTWTAGAVSQLILQLSNLVDNKEAPLVKALSIVVMVMAEDNTAATIAKAVLDAIGGPLDQIKDQQAKNVLRVEQMEEYTSNVAGCTGELQNEMVRLQVQVNQSEKV